MSWDLPKIEKDGNKTEIQITSFFGGQETGRCLQLTQVTDDMMPQFVQLSRTQLLQLLQRFEDWDSGVLDEAGSHARESELKTL